MRSDAEIEQGKRQGGQTGGNIIKMLTYLQRMAFCLLNQALLAIDGGDHLHINYSINSTSIRDTSRHEQ